MNFGAETVFPRNAWNSPQTHEILTPRAGWPGYFPGTTKPPTQPGTETRGGIVYCKGVPYGPGMTIPQWCMTELFPGQSQTPGGIRPDSDRVVIDLRPPAGVNVQPDPAHGGGIIYNPGNSVTPLPGTGAPAKKSMLPLLALGAAAYFLMG